MPNIGPMELIIVLVIVLVIFGPKRLPGLGRQLGSGMREFKDSITSKSKDDDEDVTSGRTLSAPPAPEPVATPAATSVRVDDDAPPAAPRRDA